MEEMSESERREILRSAHAILEEDIKRLESEKRSVSEQLVVNRKSLQDIADTVEAAQIKSKQELAGLRQAQESEADQLARKNDALKMECLELASRRAVKEGELNKSIAELMATIAQRRADLDKINRTVREQEARLQDVKSSFESLKSSLSKVLS